VLELFFVDLLAEAICDRVTVFDFDLNGALQPELTHRLGGADEVVDDGALLRGGRTSDTSTRLRLDLVGSRFR
jgi:hypothetical protein